MVKSKKDKNIEEIVDNGENYADEMRHFVRLKSRLDESDNLYLFMNRRQSLIHIIPRIYSLYKTIEDFDNASEPVFDSGYKIWLVEKYQEEMDFLLKTPGQALGKMNTIKGTLELIPRSSEEKDLRRHIKKLCGNREEINQINIKDKACLFKLFEYCLCSYFLFNKYVEYKVPVSETWGDDSWYDKNLVAFSIIDRMSLDAISKSYEAVGY